MMDNQHNARQDHTAIRVRLEQAKGRQDGETTGEARGQAHTILTVLQARGLSVSEEIRARS